jgi:hypothetical protein
MIEIACLVITAASVVIAVRVNRIVNYGKKANVARMKVCGTKKNRMQSSTQNFAAAHTMR